MRSNHRLRWSHLRRRFFDHAKGEAPIAREALERIAALYAIEKTIRGASADERRRVRQEKSKPLVMAFRPWLEHQLARVSGKSGIAEELRYGLNHWEGLVRFLDDGRIELDTNIVERGIRPIVLNRKNALFAGPDEGAENWACVASLIETCMCGWPPRCKGFDGDFDAGSAACMCPAYKSRPQPLALMRSADRRPITLTSAKLDRPNGLGRSRSDRLPSLCRMPSQTNRARVFTPERGIPHRST